MLSSVASAAFALSLICSILGFVLPAVVLGVLGFVWELFLFYRAGT